LRVVNFLYQQTQGNTKQAVTSSHLEQEKEDKLPRVHLKHVNNIACGNFVVFDVRNCSEREQVTSFGFRFRREHTSCSLFTGTAERLRFPVAFIFVPFLLRARCSSEDM
jgi:hypothetical protein